MAVIVQADGDKIRDREAVRLAAVGAVASLGIAVLVAGLTRHRNVLDTRQAKVSGRKG